MPILHHFHHLQLTKEQEQALLSMDDFLQSNERVFMLKGYAGTGKTTLLKGICEYLHERQNRFSLMAPTGRAAKVISQKTKQPASTIHKVIYSFNDLDEIKVLDEDGQESFKYFYKINTNADVINRIFIVDEASMVSDIESEGEFFRFGSGFLLKDLFEFSKINQPTTESKIIFIGDPAQLPPVGMNFSPALDEEYLEKTYQLKAKQDVLTVPIRQKEDNRVLQCATQLRQCISAGFYNNFDLTPDHKYIYQPSYQEFIDTYKSFEKNRIVITYKNKTAYDINQHIREDKFPGNHHIMPEDLIIVGNNNYMHGVMNGEFGLVLDASEQTISRRYEIKVKKEVVSVKLVWRYVELLFKAEDGNDNIVKGYILENNLEEDLNSAERRALYIDFKVRNPGLKPKTPAFKDAIKNDLFFNAIMLRYGYAVTCHKAQGGEWKHVFVIWDYASGEKFNFYEDNQVKAGKTNAGFYRWAYTAITRTADKLININPPYFTPFTGLSFVVNSFRATLEDETGNSSRQLEINCGAEETAALSKFDLLHRPVFLQDKFLQINMLVKSRYIDVASIEHQDWKEIYTFQREHLRVKVIFNYNKKQQFSSFQKIPAGSNSDELFVEIASLLNEQVSFVIHREEAISQFEKIEAELNIDESKPFLSLLKGELQHRCKNKNIVIADIDHQQYRERYTFTKAGKKCCIDFIYNGNGFFTSTNEVCKTAEGSSLLTELQGIINSINKPNYVF